MNEFVHYEKSVFILVLAFTFDFPSFCTPFSFNPPNFPLQTTEILHEGDSTIVNGSIHLIPTAINSRFLVGPASYYKPFHLHDSPIDGFAFFLAPVSYSIPPNSAGRGLGLFNSTTRRNPVVAVEFDTNSNSFDPPFTHIGINNGSIFSAAYVNWDVKSTSGREGHVLISYNATTKNLSVVCSYHTIPVYSYVSYIIDLKNILPDWVRVGFSAASGPFFEKKFAINSWRLDSDFDYIDETRTSKVTKKTGILIGAAGFSVLILTGIMASFLIRKISIKVSRKDNGNYALVSRDIERGTFRKRFTYKELETATNNFADDMKLGQGRSAHVYRGTLSDICHLVGVKKISVDFEKLLSMKFR